MAYDKAAFRMRGAKALNSPVDVVIATLLAGQQLQLESKWVYVL